MTLDLQGLARRIDMINTLFFAWGLVPLLMGVSFIIGPKKTVQWQKSLRKKWDKSLRVVGKKFLRRRKAYKTPHSPIKGWAFVLLGTIFMTTLFQPQWLYNALFLARAVTYAIFPDFFQIQSPIQEVRVMCI